MVFVKSDDKDDLSSVQVFSKCGSLCSIVVSLAITFGFLRAILSSLQNWAGGYRDFPYSLCPTYAQPFPTINIPNLVVHLLWLMNLWHMLINYSTVHSQCCEFMGFDKCIMMYIYHYNILQYGFTALKICSPGLSLSLPLIHWSFHCLYSSAFSRK